VETGDRKGRGFGSVEGLSGVEQHQLPDPLDFMLLPDIERSSLHCRECQ
jgi:hypothetical protein